MRVWLTLVALAGCKAQPDPAPQISCDVQLDNALRVDCETSEATRFLYESDGEKRALDVKAGVFTLSGMAANTSWSWSADGATGAFTTGSPPDELPAISVSGESTVPYVLFAVGVFAIIADSTGEIVWYQQFEGGWTLRGGGVSGFDFTPEATVLAVSESNIFEVDLSGTEKLRIEREDRPLHHDIFRADGLTYALNADSHSYPTGEFVLDGLYIYDSSGIRVASWDLADHIASDPEPVQGASAFWSEEFPGAEDYAHTNGVFAAADGTILLSLRTYDSVWALAGVDEADFGAIRWVLGGVQSDFEVTSDQTDYTEFLGQHHPRMVEDVVTVFDNRKGENARTVAVDIDEASWTAEITEVHALGASCSIQGANYPLPSGNVLATCGERHRIVEIAPDDSEVWEMLVETTATAVARGIPIAEPPPGW